MGGVMTTRIIVNGEDRTEQYARMLSAMKLRGTENRIARLFDRCCHPGKPGDGDLYFRRMFREMRS